MQTLAWLTQEIPWVMAPALLIATTAVISIISAVIRSTDIASKAMVIGCLLYTSDAADEEDSVDLGGRRIIKKKKK